MKIETPRHALSVASEFRDGSLRIVLDELDSDCIAIGAFAPAEIDRLISHLIEVRSAYRITQLLQNPFDGNITKQITEL